MLMCLTSSDILPGACHSGGSQKSDSTTVCSHGPCATHHQGEFYVDYTVGHTARE